MVRQTLVIFLLFTSVSLLGCSRNAKQVDNDASAQKTAVIKSADESGNKAPNFTLTDTQGKKLSLDQFKGHVVLVDFWATWCPPCRRGIPDLIDLQKKYGKKLTVIGISLDGSDTKDDVVPFMKKMGINYHIAYGTQKVVSDYGNIEAIPTSFIISKSGEIVHKHVGLVPKEVLESELKPLINKS